MGRPPESARSSDRFSNSVVFKVIMLGLTR